MLNSHKLRIVLPFALLVGLASFIQVQAEFPTELMAHSSDVANQSKTQGTGTVAVADLPLEAKRTLTLIKQGGPFPYPKDGTIFGNREGRLPARARGYYREYTVKTAGSRDRGARRIISGASGEFYYTDDHYNTFRLIKE
ncbi:MAG TPA: ribonuclease [Desulfomonilaceae bacterium]|nr:ribonuclease [Desulfomonilaceae bacterium]